MSIQIEVTRIDKADMLSAESWRFYFFAERKTLYLTHYERQRRATRRHKFKVEDMYNKYNRRGSSIELDDVPLPVDVASEALEKFIADL